MRNYYGAYNSYGSNMAYESAGWTVHVFDSAAERNAWVDAGPYREAVMAKTADKIAPVGPWDVDRRIYHSGGDAYWDRGDGTQELIDGMDYVKRYYGDIEDCD